MKCNHIGCRGGQLCLLTKRSRVQIMLIAFFERMAISFCLSLNPENANLRGRITVQLTSCLFCLDSAALLMCN